MKDNISVFWRCNKSTFNHVLMFSVGACAVLFFLLDISISALLIWGAVFMWFIGVTTARYRKGATQINDSNSPDISPDIGLEIQRDIQSTWCRDAVAVISVIIFWLTFFGAMYVKYKSFFPLELIGQ